jgi:hypothetical protein
MSSAARDRRELGQPRHAGTNPPSWNGSWDDVSATRATGDLIGAHVTTAQCRRQRSAAIPASQGGCSASDCRRDRCLRGLSTVEGSTAQETPASRLRRRCAIGFADLAVQTALDDIISALQNLETLPSGWTRCGSISAPSVQLRAGRPPSSGGRT